MYYYFGLIAIHITYDDHWEGVFHVFINYPKH
jgi:hypothetical protein